MSDHHSSREQVVCALRQELMGPSPQGREIDCSQAIVFATAEESYGPWRQQGTREEILQRDPPFQRYGVGVLSPLSHEPEPSTDDGEADRAIMHELEELPGVLSDDVDERDTTDLLPDARVDRLTRVVNRRIGTGADENPDDTTLSMANARKPSSMAISLLVDARADTHLIVHASGGRYRRKAVQVGDDERTWWLRSPVSITSTYSGLALRAADNFPVPPMETTTTNTDGLRIEIQIFARPIGSSANQRLLTVCLVNRTPARSGGVETLNSDERMLFQSEFRVTATSAAGEPMILPYPEGPSEHLDEEEQSLALLYRREQTFAIGHGCAANWRVNSWGHDRLSSVLAEPFPVVEIPSTTPEILREDGSRIEVSMAALAGLVPADDGMGTVEEIVSRYESWIDERRSQIHEFALRHQSAAERHMKACERSASRMRDGLRYLRSNPQVMRAFQLANAAMLLQQSRSRRGFRQRAYDKNTKRIVFTEEHPPLYLSGTAAAWRPFQIAFLLTAMASTVDGHHPERETVELIWFPTGGGKTEAYLGLAAFAMFLRRLSDREDVGTHVLMRYTLRLLTAQQFQRASALICAMEYLRSQHEDELGVARLTIGIWLGSESTPNTRSQALESLKSLGRDPMGKRNQFLLTKCPWCSAQMGPLDIDHAAPKSVPRVAGYDIQGDTVVLRCSDPQCHFHESLPVCVVDEDIYATPPTLIIGTVDKFAMLTWRPQARSLFGIDDRGERITSPPGLIIQDELHLISGPLGSMVGLYETIINELCTDRRGNDVIAPKIVSSTATIRRYTDQIRALYARQDVALFPPPGLDSGDSFFGTYARDPEGNLLPGRQYVGVHASGLGSLQTTQTRVFASLMQAPMGLAEELRDPWWTLMVFFNSIRELGTALSLFQSRVPDYLWAIRSRTGIETHELRRLDRIEELTGRLRSDEVPAAITKLETAVGVKTNAIDACLASNIIEVGIDIDRLSLMTVVGQPKTTSQYIQVTGRVGRRWWERPGLVVTILNPSRPRDRSHYEHFRSYHQRLYAQVEPTSVTPFSPPAIDRALHAVLVAYTRLTGDSDAANSPQPYPSELVERARQILVQRALLIDRDEVENIDKTFRRRIREWQHWAHRNWTRGFRDDEAAQLYVSGEYIDPDHARRSWATPMSMRNVDAECQALITGDYQVVELSNEGDIYAEI